MNNIKVNTITEFYKGHYCMILDFPSFDFIYTLLDESYKYVWGISYEWSSLRWKSSPFPLFGKDRDTQLRNVNLEFIMPTAEFIKSIPFIDRTIHVIQMQKIPPYYLNPLLLKGHTKYDLLKKEVDYLFEIELSHNPDFTEIISPHKEYLERIKLLVN